MNPTPRFEVSGQFGPLDVLWEDGDRIFCKTWREAEGGRREFVAVLPTADYPPPGYIDRLTHEYGLREYLQHEWAVRPLELVREHGRTVLLLEPRGGLPLDRIMGEPMETGRFLRLAIAISMAVHRMHELGLVHRDIKPVNILVEPGTLQVWLTGFGIASRLPRERQSPEPPELIAGTLAYMAPEQTGRMNRSIDSRSDLYSLGVTLYQTLTGKLPFNAVDPMEWVHCHIAKKPEAPQARCADIPLQLSSIVMKLLAKTPDDRYQTALGLERDLRRCLADWDIQGAIDAFALGERDITERLMIPEQLYGRENEIARLLTALDDVLATGMPRLMLVSGQPGIGKSSVVNELHKVLVPPRGLFASGKFDQLKQDIPYATLAEALQGLIRRLLGKPEAELQVWRNALRQALDSNGALAVELIPELELIIGEQPALLEVPPSAAKARNQLALRRLVGVFARPEHPLALFLDDMQWLDAATLDLLEYLLEQPGCQHLLVVGAYRDNEVDAAHPLMRKLSAIRGRGTPVHEIALLPLKHEDLTQLIADAFRCEPRRARPLARLVHERTAGNPFFANQFIVALVEQGLIVCDPSAGRWTWELGPIQARGYTENVVDLMVGKLSRLPFTTLKALKELACLGNAAETSTLAMVHGTSEAEIHSDLWEALRLELIVRSAHSYRFMHDRVQEAAYSLIPEALRPETHLRTGRLLRAQLQSGERDEAIFSVVGQLNRGGMLIAEPDERNAIAELNLRAGKRAKGAAAYASALNYLVAGAKVLAEDLSDRRHDLLFELEFHRAECEFLTGDITSAEKRALALSARVWDMTQRALVACLLADVYVALGRLDKSVATCLECLRHADLDIPLQPTEAQARAAYDQVWERLHGRTIEELAELPLMTEPLSRAKLDVLAKIARCALTQMDRHLLCLILCAAVELSLERGHCESSSYAYEYFALVAGWQFGDFEAGFRFGRLGHELVERKGFRQFEALVCLTFAIVIPWARHAEGCRDLIRKAFEVANRTGDVVSAVSSGLLLVSNLLMTGNPLVEVEEEAELGRAFCRRTAFVDFIDAANAQIAFIRNLRGLTRHFGSLDHDGFDEPRLQSHFESQPHVPVFECWYWIRRLQARFLAGDTGAALDASTRAQALLSSSPGMLEASEHELYSALTHCAACDSASTAERQRHLEAAISHQRQLDRWARSCPENFECRATLVAAEIARLEQRDPAAMQLYEQSIQAARESGFVHSEALATELAARFYFARGFDRIARTYMRDARSCYLQWGALGKARQLDQLYPQLIAEDPRTDATRTVVRQGEHLDLATVIKVLQAVSGETELEKLITALMRLGLEHAGAERGLLILPHDAGYRIEAEAGIAGETVTVALTRADVSAANLPTSALHYVLRTREIVLLPDAAAQNPFSDDEYLRQHRVRSLLCMPLLKQTRLIGVIYLENNLTSGVFTPARMAVLALLATEAAISLENSCLYGQLREREARLRRLVEANIVGIVIYALDGRIIDANDAFLRIVGYEHQGVAAGLPRWPELTPTEWHATDAQRLALVQATGVAEPYEKEFLRKDGTRVAVLVGGALFEDGQNEGVAFVVDLTERKQAEATARESERRYGEMRTQLAHANRVATVGQFSASIAHEINQPLAGILMNASAGLRMLAAATPNVQGARETLGRTVRDANRASDVIRRLRALYGKTTSATERLDINQAIREVLVLSNAELQDHGVVLELRLADDLPALEGDRIQLQQVLLNLIRNAVDAMSTSDEIPRRLRISTETSESSALVAVEDSGPGVSPAALPHIFDSFYSTKSGGLGVGLSICRGIVEAHQGKLWVTHAVPHGAIFRFTFRQLNPT
jgi:PAS domain S-box-containing protein